MPRQVPAALAQMFEAGELHPDLKLKTPANRIRWFSLHHVALSNRRIVTLDARHQTVTFNSGSS